MTKLRANSPPTMRFFTRSWNQAIRSNQAAEFDAEFSTPLEKMKLLEVPPVHHRFDLPDARLVAPGHPERSILLHRLAKRGPGQMPQLATSLIDEQAVKLVEEWIKSLDAAGKK